MCVASGSHTSAFSFIQRSHIEISPLDTKYNQALIMSSDGAKLNARRRPPGPPSRSQPTTPGTTSRYRNQVVHVPDGYLVVGRIVGAHGLHGELRTELHTDFPERFASGQSLYIGTELYHAVVTGSRRHKSFVLLQFDNIDERSEAEAWHGEWIYIQEDDAAPLESDTYWVHDIIGLRVETVDGQVLGRVNDVMFTGANEVYLVTPEDGINKGREILLPAIAEVVQSVDLDSGVIVVQLLPGLIDE